MGFRDVPLPTASPTPSAASTYGDELQRLFHDLGLPNPLGAAPAPAEDDLARRRQQQQQDLERAQRAPRWQGN